MLFLSRTEVEAMMAPGEVLSRVEDAFCAHGQGQTVMPPKIYVTLPRYGGDFRAMPAFVGAACGVKWVNSHPGNPGQNGLPTVMAVLILNDPASGEPLAVMDATAVTAYRTAAASAVATKLLSRGDSVSLGLVGCGTQAQTHLRFLGNLRAWRQVLLYDLRPGAAERLAACFPDLPARQGSLEEVCSCDVICTLTPGMEPVVRREWVKPGAHINAVGADAPGKQELDADILQCALVVADDMEQAVHSGEVNVPISSGRYRPEQLSGNLGEVLTGRISGRTCNADITVFDSTGLAIEDMAVGYLVYQRALARGAGLHLNLMA